MTAVDENRRGGIALGAIETLEDWQATLVVQLRCWCDGDTGRNDVYETFARCFDTDEAERGFATFEALVTTLLLHAHRPLIRHSVHCTCLGADECIFTHLVSTATEGHLTDAALIASLLIGPTYAEHVALIAGDVGRNARLMAPYLKSPIKRTAASPQVLH